MAGGRSRRDLIRERFWREQIQGQAASGLSVGAYCRRHRLRPSAFYYWRRALATRGQTARAVFVPVTVADEGPGVAAGMSLPRAGERGHDRASGTDLDGRGSPPIQSHDHGALAAKAHGDLATDTGGHGALAGDVDGSGEGRIQAGRGGRIEILLTNGRRVRVTGPVYREALAAVLAVVEGVPC